jgi:hypothetical protein
MTSLTFVCIYIYIRLKIKPNSVRIRFFSCQIFVLPSTGFELTPLIHCSTNRFTLRPVPWTTRPHPLYISLASQVTPALNTLMTVYLTKKIHTCIQKFKSGCFSFIALEIHVHLYPLIEKNGIFVVSVL